MKKTIVILSALLALVACNKENVQPESTPTVFNITINREDGTKAVKSDWESGDVVYVFFSTVAAPNYVKYTYNGSEWSNTKVGTFDITTNGTMTAIYLPYGNDAVVSADGTSFKFNKTFTSYFLKAEKAAYTVSGTTVSGTLNMVAPEGFVQFAMPMSGTISGTPTTFFRSKNHLAQAISYTLSDSNLKPVSFASVTADGSISVTDGTYGDAITGYIYNGDINFSGVLKSTVNGKAADYAFRFVNNYGTAKTYDDVTYLLSGNKTLSYQSAIKFPTIDNSAWKVPEPEYVEINGVKWAKWNVGASAVGGYGDYFAWGAVYPQAWYESSDYRESGIAADLTSAKDVAYQKLGSDWHMPTETDINSIFNTSNGTPADGVTWAWISDTSTYGTKGCEVYQTSNPSKKIFLPAAGNWNKEYYSTFFDYVGICWSTKFFTSNFARGLYFEDGGRKSWSSVSEHCGYSVRPVHN